MCLTTLYIFFHYGNKNRVHWFNVSVFIYIYIYFHCILQSDFIQPTNICPCRHVRTWSSGRCWTIPGSRVRFLASAQRHLGRACCCRTSPKTQNKILCYHILDSQLSISFGHRPKISQCCFPESQLNNMKNQNIIIFRSKLHTFIILGLKKLNFRS